MFPDPRLAKAVVDRITHKAHIIDTGAESWRFRHGRERNGRKRACPPFGDARGASHPGDQATSTPTTTDAKWGHFKRPPWGHCKRPLRGATPSPGLYFLGLPWQYTRGSALLGWVKHDAAHLAQAIASKLSAHCAR